MFLHIIFMLFISSGRILLNKCSVRQHMPRICLTDSVKVPRGLRAYIMIGNVTNRDSGSFHEKRESLVFFIDFFCSDTLQTHSSSTTWIVSGFTRRFQPKTSGVLFRVFPVNTVLYSAEMLFLWLNCRLLLTGMPLFYILSDLCFYMASPDLSNLVFSSGMKLVQVGNTIWVLRDEFCRIPISTLTLTGTYIHLSTTVFVFFHISHLWLLGSGS